MDDNSGQCSAAWIIGMDTVHVQGRARGQGRTQQVAGLTQTGHGSNGWIAFEKGLQAPLTHTSVARPGTCPHPCILPFVETVLQWEKAGRGQGIPLVASKRKDCQIASEQRGPARHRILFLQPPLFPAAFSWRRRRSPSSTQWWVKHGFLTDAKQAVQ